ncbi:MAG: hypothetical protein RIS46_975 [Actinomycetota bacterium]|jgi:hypothetical protein
MAVQRPTEGFIMSVNEAERFDMQVGLRLLLGDEVANTLMEHLPPSGWSDVARTRDIEFLDKRLEMIEKRFNIVISVGIAWGLALIALQVQIMLSISHL